MDIPRLIIAKQVIFPGKRFDFGTLSVSENEIIEFARVSDPLHFHIDREAAAKSHFGKIVASGPHLFSAFHKQHWIPIFDFSVIAGLAIRNWEFLKPHFADENISGVLEVMGMVPKIEKGIAIIHWKYFFSNPSGELVQTAEFQVMHKID